MRPTAPHWLNTTSKIVSAALDQMTEAMKAKGRESSVDQNFFGAIVPNALGHSLYR
jgi:hypothetical protein